MEAVTPIESAAVPRRATTQARQSRDWLILACLPLLLVAAWAVTIVAPVDPKSDGGYYLGLTGGVMMLLLLLYPLKKRVRLMRNWGHSRYWFAAHMALGIGGPLLVLVHSSFRFGSINAGVALVCMTLVAASGVIGRFIYVRIHQGLYGRRLNLADLRAQAGAASADARSMLNAIPAMRERLDEFEARAQAHQGTRAGALFAFVAVPAMAYRARRDCRRILVDFMRLTAQARGWDREKTRRRYRAAKHQADRYIRGVRCVAQFNAYERLFSLWHVVHIPFVYMLVLSGIAHVVAVHLY
jgi:hypothetical protein